MNNINNKSLGKRSTNGLPLNSSDEYTNKSVSKVTRKFRSGATQLAALHGGIEAMRENLIYVQAHIDEGLSQGRKVSPKVKAVLASWIANYENAVKSSIGMPTLSDSITTQREAPADIPTAPLDGFQLLRRTCYLTKLASSGTTAGGFYAELFSSDLVPFLGTNVSFRVSKVSSWTAARGDNTGNTTFAGVSVAAQDGTSSTDSIIPIWSENRTPIGIGFAGIITEYPTGDFPYYTASSVGAKLILSHFTSLGGTGGITGMPVVFHVTVDCLI